MKAEEEKSMNKYLKQNAIRDADIYLGSQNSSVVNIKLKCKFLVGREYVEVTIRRGVE